MDVPVSELEGRFDELVVLARSGEAVIVVKDGKSVAQLMPVAQRPAPPDAAEIARRTQAIREIQQAVRKQFEGRAMPSSDHSDMYDELGLPN